MHAGRSEDRSEFRGCGVPPVPWLRRKTLVTKGGSLGRSGIWKSLTLSRHDAAGPAIPPPALFSPSLRSPPMPPGPVVRAAVGRRPTASLAGRPANTEEEMD